MPEAASSWFLPRVVGINTALEWTFTGRVFPADEALARGLVRSVHAPDDLLPAAYEIAAEIASTTSAVSVSMTRQMLWRMLGAPGPMDAHQVDSNAIAKLGKSADVREGVLCFLEKRPPAFTDQVPQDIPDPVAVLGGAGVQPPPGLMASGLARVAAGLHHRQVPGGEQRDELVEVVAQRVEGGLHGRVGHELDLLTAGPARRR